MKELGWLSAAGLAMFLMWEGTRQDPTPVGVTAAPSTQWVHPFQLPQVYRYPDDVLALIEIPQGSFTKYEIDPKSGFIAVDRFQSMPVVYPANYGTIPSTLAGDGDNLDVLVLTREPIIPGALIRVRPIGMLQMVDGGERDDKLIAVPISDVDPSYDSIRTLSDLPGVEIDRIEAFFRVYKQLPAGRKIVELNGFCEADQAKALVKKAIEEFQR